jgi:molybdopterin-guanine dinucleotide biosynthesis protein B
MIHEHTDEAPELTLENALQQLSTDTIDMVIVEGFKSAPISKIEIHRPSIGKPLISASDQYVIAIATDEPNKIETDLPLLDLNSSHSIADYIEQFLTNHNL